MPYQTFFRLPEEKKKRICDAALAEFILYQDQYSKASVNRIAEAAGISIGSLYKYFSGKHDLFLYLYDLQVVESEPDPALIQTPALRSYAKEKLKYRYKESTAERDLLFRIILNNKEELLYPLFFDNIKNTVFYSTVLGYLKQDKQAGVLREDIDLEQAAYIYLMVDFLAYNYCEFKEDKSEYIQQTMEGFLEIFFHGIYRN